MASGKTAILSMRVLGDARGARKAVDETVGSLDKLEGRTQKAAAAMSAISAGVIAFGKQAFEAASDLQQSAGGVEAVFGETAGKIKELSDAASQAVGLSKNEYNELATVMGAQLKNMGVASDEVAGQTEELVNLGADLAATFGGTTADAVSALSSLMRGEADPIERYGVSIKKATIEARLQADGLADLEGEARKAAETQTLLKLLTEQTADAHGAFAREADTAAGQMQRASAEWTNAKAALGEQLLPIVTEAAVKFGEFAKWVGEHPNEARQAATAIGVVTGALLGIVGAIKAYKFATEAAKFAQIALNFAMSANPIGIVIVALAALAAGIVYAYNHSEKFREIVHKVGQVAKAAFDGIVNAIKPVIDWISKINGAVQDVISILFKGDYTGGLGVFGFAEDSKVVDWLFNIRESVLNILHAFETVGKAIGGVIGDAIKPVIDWISKINGAVQDVISILFKGDYTGGLGVFGFAEDSKVVDWLFNIREGALAAWDFIKQLWGWIKDTATTVGELALKFNLPVQAMLYLKDHASQIFNAIGGYIRSTFDVIKSAITWILDFATSFGKPQTQVQMLRDLASKVFRKVNEYVGKTTEYVVDLARKAARPGEVIRDAMNVGISAIKSAISWVKSLISWVRDAWDSLTDLFSFGGHPGGGASYNYAHFANAPALVGVAPPSDLFLGVAPPSMTAAATLRPPRIVPRTRHTSAPSRVYNINVETIHDPEHTAREIKAILERYDERQSW